MWSLLLGGHYSHVRILSLSTLENLSSRAPCTPSIQTVCKLQNKQFPLSAYRQTASQLLAEGTAHKFSSGDQGKLINYLTHVQFLDTAQSTAGDASTVDVSASTERPVTAGGREQTASPKKSR